jgi:hypothetical protein
MPYVKCSKCHHEWEISSRDKKTIFSIEEDKCDWCGAPYGKVLEKKTPLERMMNIPIERLLNILKGGNENV